MSRLRAKKSLGQNFLSDQRVVDAIIDACETGPADRVLEIGPGTGVLTRMLAEKAGQVVAVELDERLMETLGHVQATYPSLRVVWADFLKSSWEDLGLPEEGTKVVGNIPYYITGPILSKLLHADIVETQGLGGVEAVPERIVLMVQKEVADRLMAKPGSKDYGSLSVFAQFAARIEEVLFVPRRSFRPAPKVDSMVIRLWPRREPPVKVAKPRAFFRVVKGAFGQRRKTLQNALMAAGYPKEALLRAWEQTGIDPQRRGETLSLEEFSRLTDALERECAS